MVLREIQMTSSMMLSSLIIALTLFKLGDLAKWRRAWRPECTWSMVRNVVYMIFSRLNRE